MRAIESTTASLAYLEKELLATSIVESRTAIGRLMEAQINRRMFANVTEEYVFRIAGKALPPDRKDVVRPRKLLMSLLGVAIGLTVGVLAALIIGVSPSSRVVA
jgi:LPS O-antigen subunit length determinant protein (WzzB/FepE family)